MYVNRVLSCDSLHSAPLGSEARERCRKSVYVLMALLILYVSVRGLAGAATKPFGYDEIMTQTVASQPGLRGIWEALERALDGQAPVFYVLEHATMGLVSNVHVALRLPSILAMDCTLICMFLYMNKCSGTLVAFLCTLLLLS